ncbi:MAG: HEAT repeat domain-containing protein [Planctomycetota bacterium]
MSHPPTSAAAYSIIAAAFVTLGCGSGLVGTGFEAELAELQAEFGPGRKAAVASVAKDLEKLRARPDDRIANRFFARSFALLGEFKTREEMRNHDELEMFFLPLMLIQTNCGVTTLVRASRSAHPMVRNLAATALAFSGSREALPRLRELFDDPAKGLDEDLTVVFFPLRETTGVYSSRELFALVTRKSMISRLGEAGARAASPLLAERLPGADDHEKKWLLQTLGKLKADAAVPVIAPLLEHEKHKFTALAALAEIGTRRAERALLDAFEKGVLRKQIPYWLAEAKMGSETSVPVLVRGLKEAKRHAVQAKIIRELGRIGGKAGVDALLREQASGRNKTDIAIALARARDKRAVKWNVKRMLDRLASDWDTLRSDHDVLDRLRAAAPRIVPELLEFLASRDLAKGDGLTWYVIKLLVLTKDPRTVQVLERAYEQWLVVDTSARRAIATFPGSFNQMRKDIALVMRELTGKDYKYACVHEPGWR